ncbi:MAG: hypothetical protein ACTSP3_00015 [Candidatus Heimdallarchaeaceae archaeon]
MDVIFFAHNSASTTNYGFLSCIPQIQKIFNVNYFTYPSNISSYYIRTRKKESLDRYFNKKIEKKRIFEINTAFKGFSYNYFLLSYKDVYSREIEFPTKLCWITNQEIEIKTKESFAKLFRLNKKEFEQLIIVADSLSFKEINKNREFRYEIDAEYYLLENYIEHFNPRPDFPFSSINFYLNKLLTKDFSNINEFSKYLQANSYDLANRYINMRAISNMPDEFVEQSFKPYIEHKQILNEFERWVLNLKKEV